MRPHKLLAIGVLVSLAALLTVVLSGGTSAPPADPFPGEMFELSYARHANTPEWVRMCEAKLEWRLKDFEWNKQNSYVYPRAILDEQIARNRRLTATLRAG
jgi:hypothetical protein